MHFEGFLRNVGILVITPHGRAGSVFFQGLFDGCESFIVLPYYFNEYSFWDHEKSIEKNVYNFCKINPMLFRSFKSYLYKGFKDYEVKFEDYNEKKFCEDIINLLKMYSDLDPQKIDRKIFLCAVYYCFGNFYNQDIKKVKYILFHIHHYDFPNFYSCNVEKHLLIMNDFKNSKYIPLIRATRSSMHSYIKEAQSLKDVLLVARYIEVCYLNLKILLNSRFKNQIFIVNFEKVHEQGADCMHAVCEFINVSFCDILKYSTYRNIKWYGESKNFSSTATFDPERGKYFLHDSFSEHKYSNLEGLFKNIFKASTSFYPNEYSAKINVFDCIRILRIYILESIDYFKINYCAETSSIYKKIRFKKISYLISFVFFIFTDIKYIFFKLTNR